MTRWRMGFTRAALEKAARIKIRKTRTPLFMSFFTCPFPIRPYAVRKYGQEFIDFYLAQVQVCTHGWICGKCCFLYRGRVYRAKYRRDLDRYSIDPSVLQRYRCSPEFPIGAAVQSIMWDFLFAWWPGSLWRSCDGGLCVNPQHCYLKRVDEHSPWRFVEVCVHGYECKDCCWPWQGEKIPTDCVWSDGSYGISEPNLAELMHNEMCGMRKPKHTHQTQREFFYEQGCGDKWCANPNHIKQCTQAEFRQRNGVKISLATKGKPHGRKSVAA